MGVRRPAKAYVVNNGKIFPASVYSRPALPPWYQGVNGFGQARSTSNEQFEYTLKQMAASPFSVNNKAYMQRIRDEYGYEDNGVYDTMGVVGGVVGAGVGFMYSSGLLRNSLTNRKFWQKSAWQNPWTGKINPKRTRTNLVYQTGPTGKAIKQYNNYIDLLSENKMILDEASNLNVDALSKLDAANIAKAKAKGKVAKQAAQKVVNQASDEVAKTTKLVTSATKKTAATTADVAKAADTLQTTYGVAVKPGSKVSMRIAGLMPYAGTALDILGLTMSTAGLIQSIQEADALNIALNSVMVVGDSAAVAGDIISLVGAKGLAASGAAAATVVGAPIGGIGALGSAILIAAGETISIVGGLVSAGAAAIQGFLVGQTIGGSFSAEGAKAQQLYADNLYSSMVQRPVTTVGSAIVMAGIPLAISGFSKIKTNKGPLRYVVGHTANWLGHNALGNQVRAGISMMTLQGLSAITTPLDDSLPWAPDDPNDMNFVSAISLYGDINDNIYGATRNKAILLGLVTRDSSAMTKAMAESWGYDEGMYRSVMFNDIREAAGLDLTPFGNSLIGVLGEMIIDPQNWHEMSVRIAQDRLVTSATAKAMRIVEFKNGEVKLTGGVAKAGDIGKLLEDTGLLKGSLESVKQIVQRLITAKVTGGEKAYIKAFADLTSTKFKGHLNKTYKVTDVDLGNQRAIFGKFLDEVFAGTYKLQIGNKATKTEVSRAYKEYVDLKKRSDAGESLDVDKAKFLSDMARLYEKLKNTYGSELNEAQLVDNFINQTRINVRTEDVAKFYTHYNDIKVHEDLSNALATKIMTVTNPMTKLVQASSFGLGKLMERNRATTSAKQKNVSIVNLKAISDEAKNITKIDDLEIAQAESSKEAKELSEILTRSNKTLSDEIINDDIAKDSAEVLKENSEEQLKEKREIEVIKKDVETTRERIKELRKGTIIQGRKYTRGKTEIYIDANEIGKIEDDVKNYRRDRVTGKPLTLEETQVKIRMDLRSPVKAIRDEAKAYNAKYTALLDYTWATQQLDTMDDVLARVSTAVQVLDTASMALNDAKISLISSINVFKRYINHMSSKTKGNVTVKTPGIDLDPLEDLFNDKTLSMLDRMLPLFGFTIRSVDEKGNPIVVKSLKAFKMAATYAPLELEYTPTLRESVLSVVRKNLYITDTEIIMRGILNIDVDFKNKWDFNDAENNRKLITNMLSRLNLDEETTIKILEDDKVLLDIYNAIQQYIEGKVDYIPLSKINDNEINAIVYARAYEAQGSHVKQSVDKAIEYLENAQKLIETAKASDEVKKQPYWNAILNAHVHDFNHILHGQTAYKFMKAYLYPKMGENKLGLFIDPEVYRNMLPDTISTEKLKKIREEKGNYTKEEVIKNFRESAAVQSLYIQIKDQWEYIKRSKKPLEDHTDIELKQGAIEAVAEAETTQVPATTRSEDIKQLRKQTNDSKRRYNRVKKKATDALSTLDAFQKVDPDKRRVLTVDSDLLTDNFFRTKLAKALIKRLNLPAVKHMTVSQKNFIISQIVKMGFSGRLSTLKLGRITYELTPSKHSLNSKGTEKNLVSFFDLLEKNKRTSPGHTQYLRVIAAHIMELIKANKTLELDTNRLVYFPKRYATQSDAEWYVDRIIATYQSKDRHKTVRLYADTKNNMTDAIMTTKFKKALKQAMYMYALRHYDDTTLFGKYDIQVDDTFKEEDMNDFMDKLSKDDSPEFNKARVEIYKDAAKIFNDKLKEHNYTKEHGQLQSFTDKLFQYEVAAVKSLTDRHRIIAKDVFKKLLLGELQFEDLLNDIIDSKNMEENPDHEYKTGLFKALKNYYKYITVDYKVKHDVIRKNFVRFDWDKTKQTTVFKAVNNQGVEKDITMMSLLFEYRINDLRTFNSLLDSIIKKNAYDPEALITLRTNATSEFMALLNANGLFLTADTLGVKTNEDFDSLIEDTDFENDILLQNLRLKDLLDRDLAEDTRSDGRPRATNNARYLPDYINDDINKLYEGSKRRAEREQRDVHEVLMEDVLFTRSIRESVKKKLFRRVFFYQFRIAKGYYSDTELNKKYDLRKQLEDTIKELKDNGKDTTDKVFVLKALENEIKQVEHINQNYEHSDLQATKKDKDGNTVRDHEKTFDNFYRYLKTHPNELRKIYKNIIESSTGQYVTVNTKENNKDHYILVKKENVDGTLNYTLMPGSTGLGTYNKVLGEEIIKKTSIPLRKELAKAIANNKDWQANLNGVAIKEVSKYGAIIVLPKGLTEEAVKEFKNQHYIYLSKLEGVALKELYFLTDEQYTNLKSMVTKSNYTDEYLAVKTKDGYAGHELNLINRTATEPIKAYMHDLDMFNERSKAQGVTVNELVENVTDYSTKIIDNPNIKNAYMGKTSLNKTSYFMSFIEDAEINAAFLRFVKLIDPTGHFEKFNMETIATRFFKEDLIKIRDDGTFFNTSHLDKIINNPKELEYLKNTTYKHESLYSLIQKAIYKMQQEYGKRTDIKIDYGRVLTDEFLNKVDEITAKLNTIFYNMKRTHNTIIKDVVRDLDSEETAKFITHTTGAETSERRKYTKQLDTPIRNDKGEYIYDIKNPYANLKQFDNVERNKAVQALKDSLKEQDTNGDTLESHIVLTAREIRKNNQTWVRMYNDSQKKTTKDRLNLRAFWVQMKQFNKIDNEIFGDGLSPKKKYRLKGETVFNTEYNKELRTYTNILFKRYMEIKDSLNDPLLTAKEKTEIRKTIKHITGSDYILKTEEDFYNYVLHILTYYYTANVHTTAVPPSIREIMDQAAMALLSHRDLAKTPGLYVDFVKEQYEKIHKDMEKTKFRINDKLRNTPSSNANGGEVTRTVDHVNDVVFKLLGSDEREGLYETLMHIEDEYESFLFKKNPKIPTDTNIEFERDQQIYHTIKEYFKTLPQDPELQQFYQDLMQLIVFHNKKIDIDAFLNRNRIGEQDSNAEKLPINFFDNIYATLQNQKYQSKAKNTSFNDNFEIISLLSTPVLDDIADFRSYVRDYFLGNSVPGERINGEAIKYLAQFGITEPQQYSLFDANNYTLRNVLNTLAPMLDKGEMYALVQVINMLKEQYLNKHYKGAGWSWAKANRDFIDRPIKDAVDEVKGLEATGVFARSSVWKNSVIEDLSSVNDYIKKAQTFVGETNRTLQTILIDDSELKAEEFGMDPVYLTTSENNILTLQRKYEREIYGSIFSYESTSPLTAMQQYEYNKAINDVVLDSMAEEFARTLGDVGKNSPLFQEIRTHFTGLYNTIRGFVGGVETTKDFIKMRDIGYAFGSAIKDKDTIAIWRRVFKEYKSRMVGQDVQDKYNMIMTELIKRFATSGYLVKADSDAIEAVLGRILFQRGVIKSDTVENTAQMFYEETTDHIKNKRVQALATLNGVAYALNPSRSLNEIAFIIYEKSFDEIEKISKNRKVDKKTRDKAIKDIRTLKHVINLHKVINAGLGVNYDRIYDTFDNAQGVVKPRAYAETTTGKIYLNLLQQHKEVTNSRKYLISKQREFKKKLEEEGITTNKEVVAELTRTSSELTVLKNKLNTLNKDLDDLRVVSQEEKEEVLLNILLKHPTLLSDYISKQEKTIGEIQLEIDSAIEKAYDKIPDVVREEYERRRTLTKERAEFYNSINYKLWLDVRRSVGDDEDFVALFDVYANDLAPLNIQSPSEMSTWFRSTTKTNEAYNQQVKDFEVYKLKDADNKELRWKGKAKDLDKAFKNIDVSIKELEYKQSRQLNSVEDIDRNLRIQIVTDHMNKLKATYIAETKDSYNKVFKAKSVDKLDQKVINTLTDKVNEATTKQQEIIKTEILPKLSKYGHTENDDALNFINKKITELEKAKDTKGVYALKLIKNRLLNVENKINHNKDIITNLKVTEATSTEELVRSAAVKWMKDNEIPDTEEGILSVVEFLTGSYNNDTAKAIKETKTLIEDAGTVIKEHSKREQAINEYLEDNIKKINELTVKQTTLKKDVAIQKTMHDRIHEENVVDMDVYGLSNLGIFKRYYKLDPNDNEGALRVVLAESYKDSDTDLDKAIREAGDGTVELHNPVVDVLITRLNYLAQIKAYNKPVPKTFVVFDMETVKDERGNDVPYQMTMLKQSNGKFTLLNNYFNGIAFMDFKVLPDKTIEKGELLEGFYKQQAEMLAKTHNKNLNDINDLNWVTAKTDELVKKIRGTKNNLIFIENFIGEMTSHSDYPIIAHNGVRFDLPNFDRFIANISSRLLTNLYYSEMKQDSIESIKERFGNTSTGSLIDQGLSKDLISEYQLRVNKIMNKIQDPNKRQLITDAEWRRLDAFRDEIWKVRALAVIKEMQRAKGLVIDEALLEQLLTGNDSEAAKVRKQLFDYMRTTDTTIKAQIRIDLIGYFEDGFSYESNKQQRQEIIKFVDELLLSVVDRYNKYRDGSEKIDYDALKGLGRTTKILDNVNTRLGTTSEDKDYNDKDLLDGFIVMLDSINQTIDYVKGTDTDLTTTVKDLELKRKALENDRVALEDTLRNLHQEADANDIQRETIIKSIEELAVTLNNRLKNPAYTASRAIINNIEDAKTRRDLIYNNTTSAGLLRLEMDEQIRLLDNKLIELQNIISMLKEPLSSGSEELITAALKKFTMSDDILKVKDDAARVSLIETYNNKITELKEYLKNTKAGTQKIDTYITEKLVEIKEQTKAKVLMLYKDLESSWNTTATKKLLGKDGEPLIFNDTEKVSHETYEKLMQVLFKHRDLRDDPQFEDLKMRISNISRLVKDINLDNTKDVNDLQEGLNKFNFKDLLIGTINADIITHTDYIKSLQSINFSDRSATTRTYEAINKKFDEYITQTKVVDSLNKQIETKTLFNVLRGAGVRSTDLTTDAEKFMEAAKYEDSNDTRVQEAQEKVNKHIKRIYKSALFSDDKMALQLKNYSDTNGVYRSEQTVGNQIKVSVSVYDQENDGLQTMSWFANKPDYVTFEFSYKHIEIGNETVEAKAKTIKITNKNKNFNTMFMNFYSYKGLSGGIPENLLYKPTGVDHSLQSMKKLVSIYNNKEYQDNKGMKLAAIRKASTIDSELHISKLDLVNITEKMETKFNKELELIQLAKRGNAYSNMKAVYAGIASKMLSKFNALIPGKVLNMIPTDYSQGFIMKYDDASLKEKGIALETSSEGSAGSSFMLRNIYTTDTLFKHNVNPIRSVLSSKNGYSDITTIGIINELFALDDTMKNKTNNFMEYIIDNKLGLSKERADILKKRLIQTYAKNKHVDMFTPNVMTPDMHKKYTHDMLHKVGINATVMMVNLPQAFEDTILVDAEFARTMGWDEGNKTWLSQYGFKGAVLYWEGLKNDFGADFVGSADSVADRGAYGIVLEMTLNNLRKHLLGIKADVEYSKDMLQLIKDKDAEIRKVFTIEDGKIIIDPNKDYSKILAGIFTDAQYGTHWRDLYQTRVTHSFEQQLTDGKRVMFNLKDVNAYRGEVYVIQDAEHTAESMANKAEVDAAGGIKNVMKDLQGSVKSGVVISPSVIYTMMAKGNVDWLKAFPPYNDKLNIYSEVMIHGVTALKEKYLKDEDGNVRSVNDLMNTIQKYASNNLSKYVLEYLEWETKLKNADLETKAWIELHLKQIDLKIKQQALDSLDSRHGAYYQSLYRKHEGIRQQLVANTTLKQGEVRVSLKGWQGLIDITDTWESKGNTWLQTENITSIDKWEMITSTKGMSHTLDTKDLSRYIDRLNSFGVLKQLYTTKEQGDKTTVTFKAKKQYYGYVMAVRSPVQDYNATPMIKVIGFNTHEATEANPYIYLMIGGDNDGDTIGMVAIGTAQYKHLKGLDATDPNYYDAGYLDSQRPETDIKSAVELDIVDARTAYVGKSTFKVPYTNNKGAADTLKIRKGYTWDELHKIAYEDAYKKELRKITAAEIKDAELLLNKTPELLRTYLNVVVREISGGQNETKDFTGNHYIIGYDEFYKTHKDEILRRLAYSIKVDKGEVTYDQYLTEADVENYKQYLSEADLKAIENIKAKDLIKATGPAMVEIKDKLMYNKLYQKILQNTIERIQVSKRGINIFGGDRKLQIIASILSTLPTVNTDVSGALWDGYRVKGKLTVESITKVLVPTLNVDDVKSLNKNEFIEAYGKKIPTSTPKEIQTDKDILLGIIYDNYSKYLSLREELVQLGKAIKTNTAEAMLAFLKSASIADDPVISNIIKRLEVKATKLTDVEMTWLKAMYFGRFSNDANKFFKASDVVEAAEEYASGYIKQVLIDRRAFREMSDKATEIIAVAKHFGVDVDSVKFLKNFEAQVKKITGQTSLRHVYYGEDRTAGVAMAMDQKKFTKDEIKIVDKDLEKEISNIKKEKVPSILDPYISKSDYSTRLKRLITDSAKSKLFINAIGIPDSIYKTVEDTINNVFNILNKTRDLNKALENPEFEKGLQLLLTYNIPSYRVLDLYKKALTTFKAVNNLYNLRYSDTLKYEDMPYLKNGFYYFELATILGSREARAQFEVDYKKHPVLLNFMLNRLDVDPSFIEKQVVDADGNLDVTRSEEVDEVMNLITTKDRTQDSISHMSTASGKDFVGQVVSDSTSHVKNAVESITRGLNLINAKEPFDIEYLINSLLAEKAGIKKVYDLKKAQLNKSKHNYKSEKEIATDLMNVYVFGQHNIDANLNNMNAAFNNYSLLKKAIAEKESQINKINAEIYNNDVVASKIDEQKEYFKTINNKKALLKSLNELKTEYEQRIIDVEERIFGYAFNEKFSDAVLLLHTPEGRNMKNMTLHKPKFLTQDNIDEFKHQRIMTLDSYQTPFLTTIEVFKNKNNNTEYDWDGMFEWYKGVRRFNRLTVVMNPYTDETLLKGLKDLVTKDVKVTVDDKLTFKELLKRFKVYMMGRKSIFRFQGEDDFQKFIENVTGEEQPKVRFNAKTYNGIDKTLDTTQQLGPTLKEVNIKNAADLKEVFEFLGTADGAGSLIGFVDLNHFMTAMDTAYKPYRLEGKFASAVMHMQANMKLAMRFSTGFLFRNLMDTWNQLFSEMYIQQGGVGMLRNAGEILRYMGLTMDIYNVYEAVSEERLLTLTDVNLNYNNLIKAFEAIKESKEAQAKVQGFTGKYVIDTKTLDTVKTIIADLFSKVDGYVNGAKQLPNSDKTSRIKNRMPHAEELLKRLNHIEDMIIDMETKGELYKIDSLKDKTEFKESVTFVMNTHFAEFFSMYEGLQIDNTKVNSSRKRIEHLTEKYKQLNYNDFRHMLFEISAFMNTNAQLDVYKQESYRYLSRINNRDDMVLKTLDDLKVLSYEEVVDKIKSEQDDYQKRIAELLFEPVKYFFTGHLIKGVKAAGKNIMNIYDKGNSWIESTARIGGFLFDRYLHNYDFDTTVNRSLKRWFNYGQKAPLESQLLADIPYLSFPVRSIDNWLERLTNPKYMRVMSDVMDGVYGQYADEDGQHNNFTKFMMHNGWLPIGGGFGLRMGDGAYDVQSILSDPSGTVVQRRSPILRAVSTLVQTGDMTETMKALATVGVLTRTANTLMPREIVQTTPVVQDFVSKKPRSIGTTVNFTFDHKDYKTGYGYGKYTPYGHRNNNGRYERYENIYKNWFNKYGRMRVPKVDPIGLVKDIKWQQYVRYRRSQNMLR